MPTTRARPATAPCDYPPLCGPPSPRSRLSSPPPTISCLARLPEPNRGCPTRLPTPAQVPPTRIRLLNPIRSGPPLAPPDIPNPTVAALPDYPCLASSPRIRPPEPTRPCPSPTRLPTPGDPSRTMPTNLACPSSSRSSSTTQPRPRQRFPYPTTHASSAPPPPTPTTLTCPALFTPFRLSSPHPNNPVLVRLPDRLSTTMRGAKT